MTSEEQLKEIVETISGKIPDKDTTPLLARVVSLWKTDRANLKRHQERTRLAVNIETMSNYIQWIKGTQVNIEDSLKKLEKLNENYMEQREIRG